MPKQSSQPQLGKTLKLCKNKYFEGKLTCQSSRHNLNLGKH
jgi:hypothetical protein